MSRERVRRHERAVPVAVCGALQTWGFSFSDNRFELQLVTYGPDGAIVLQTNHPGPRYLSDITLDAGAETATFHGQHDFTTTVPWSRLRP